MGYEVLTAFFLEAGFLGVMLFGLSRVGRGLHFSATCLVAVGTLMSAFWILSVNSWMQTPQGFTIGPEGRFLPADWFKIIFNPSFPYRLVHMVLASYLSVAFVVGAVGARHLLRSASNPAARIMFSMAMWMATVVAPIQILAGDMHGLNTLHYQPIKVAAMEGDWETAKDGDPLILFAIPDQQAERNEAEVSIPKLGSLILTHSLNGVIKGLKEYPADQRPYVPIVFFAFRIMVGLGSLMALVGVVSVLLRIAGQLFTARKFQWLAVAMGPSGFIALLAGWTVTETGRQPFTVYGMLRTAESVSPIGAPGVAMSLAAFAVVYLIVFGAGIAYILRLMTRPPMAGEEPPRPSPVRTAGLAPGPVMQAGPAE
jgi:cytochrome d ubiquinol oxidase subunit I